jgi:hypothetical protein
MSFKVGDLQAGDTVECIDDGGSGFGNLTKGKTYTVVDVTSDPFGAIDGVRVIKHGTAWYPRRFKKVSGTSTAKVVKRVRCVDAVGTLLIQGNAYHVVQESQNYYLLQEIRSVRLDGMFRAGRFQDDTSSPTPRSGPTTDLSDWKVWRDQGLQPGHCVCGCPKQLCSYHKEG